jgi:outer membrane protein OmpA-like peptidoglycan-associated protein
MRKFRKFRQRYHYTMNYEQPITMKRQAILTFAILLFISYSLSAQTSIVEGYTYESDNRGYLQNVQIELIRARTGETVAQARSDKDGYFTLEVPRSKEYLIVAKKRMYESREEMISTIGLKEGEKVFIKMEMERKPGYIFDVTIAEKGLSGKASVVNAITGARIEIYNNTQQSEELVLNDFQYPTFNFGFEKGNHYTIMIRKKGYLTKRIEAYVNVAGCILCFDGLGSIKPEVTEVMSHGLESGTFLANIEMEPVEINKTFKIDNIYYDYDKWDIRPDAAERLDQLIIVLKDNPGITMELGSHTDCRGGDPYNLTLSQKRAQSAVDYILGSGYINEEKIFAKGYGEKQLANNCDDGVPCSEEQHQENRRTELKIIGIEEEDPLDKKNLKDIIEEEKLLEEVLNGEIIKIPEVKEDEKKKKD